MESSPGDSNALTLLRSPNIRIDKRMDALFVARNFPDKSEAVSALIEALTIDKKADKPSYLFQHEVAYVLGQIGSENALDVLMNLLKDVEENEMVRHEAAEALAAIGSQQTVEVVQRFTDDASTPVRETCLLALLSLRAKGGVKLDSCVCGGGLDEGEGVGLKGEAPPSSNAEELSLNAQTHTTTGLKSSLEFSSLDDSEDARKTAGNPFTSVDPIGADLNATEADISSLAKVLIDFEAPLASRYKALFTLRNFNNDASVEAIATSLIEDKVSALYRHEAAFVLGQLQHRSAASALIECLENVGEHPMARHEAALALGSIVSDWRAGEKGGVGSEVESKGGVYTLDPEVKVRDKDDEDSLIPRTEGPKGGDLPSNHIASKLEEESNTHKEGPHLDAARRFALDCLLKNLNDEHTVVSESCFVALNNIYNESEDVVLSKEEWQRVSSYGNAIEC